MHLSDAEVAVAAADAGAAVVRARFGAPLRRFEKAPMDFATDADIDAERAIVAVLRAARPGDAYRGEELGTSGNCSSERAWLVDPICGTLNFAAQTSLLAVNVALQAGAHVEVAACADPIAGEVFWTDGTRAYGRRGARLETLQPSAATRLVDINVDPPFCNESWFQAARLLTDPVFLARFQPRVLSTTLALAWVAAGRRAGYVTDSHVHGSVHFSAGVALCRGAGCIVSGLRGQPLGTSADGLVAAADGKTHAALIEIIGRLRDPA